MFDDDNFKAPDFYYFKIEKKRTHFCSHLGTFNLIYLNIYSFDLLLSSMDQKKKTKKNITKQQEDVL